MFTCSMSGTMLGAEDAGGTKAELHPPEGYFLLGCQCTKAIKQRDRCDKCLLVPDMVLGALCGWNNSKARWWCWCLSSRGSEKTPCSYNLGGAWWSYSRGKTILFESLHFNIIYQTAKCTHLHWHQNILDQTQDPIENLEWVKLQMKPPENI